MNLSRMIPSFLRPARKKTPTMLQMEATECGAASLGMILAYYGRYEPLEKLRAECGVSRNGSKASLILKAARGYHLDAKGYRVLTEHLDELEGPLILFWNFEHFVVYEGHSRNGKYFYLNDPATGPRVVDRELFEKSYTGVALEFRKTPEFRKGGRPLSVFRAMIPMISGMKSVMAAVVWGGLLLVIPGITVPALMQIFVDRILPGKSEWLVPVLLLFILTILLQTVLSWLVSLALRRGELQLAVNKTMEMMNFLFRLPMGFFLQRSNGDVQTRVGLNSSVANAAFGKSADNIVKFFTALFFLILMFQFSPLLSFVSLGFLLLDLLFLWIVNKRRQILNQSLMMVQTRMLSSVMSGVSMMENLRAAGREDSVFLQWTGQLADLNRKQLEFQVSVTYFNLLPSFLNAVGNVLILCVGAWLIMNGDLTLGGMFAFQTLTASFTAPFTALMMSGAELQTMKADVERINDVYKYEPEKSFRADDGSERVPPDHAVFEMKNVTFGYSRQEPPVLEDFSLKVTPGKRVALVGASGSGKTTVAKLANGTLLPWSGEILLNGKPMNEYTRSEYYATVGTVDQSIMLFSGTVGQNLTLFAPSYEARELQQAVRDAAIEQELTARGPMLELNVEEGGNNFSGGQRQRLEIARALTYRTPLLILDEATSALDPVTEVEIDKAIRRRGCACIVVAHRLSTIRDCDEIIMLDHGIVAERGTHEALMAAGGKYAAMMKLEQGG